MTPSSPVVKKKIIASCGFIIIRMKADDKNTIVPREMLKTAAIAIGSVLNGLITNPTAGKKTGADWSITANAVKKPPILINLATFITKKYSFQIH